MLNGLLLNTTIGALGGTDKASFDQVVPGENAFMAEKPYKSRNLGPVVLIPYQHP